MVSALNRFLRFLKLINLYYFTPKLIKALKRKFSMRPDIIEGHLGGSFQAIYSSAPPEEKTLDAVKNKR